MTQNTPLKKYLFIFAGANLAMMVIAAVVLTLLDMDGNAGVNMGILIGSAMAAGHYFIKDHQRLPTAAEKRWLVFMSFLASVLVSLLFVLVVVLLEPNGFAVIMMTSRWFISWCCGWVTALCSKGSSKPCKRKRHPDTKKPAN